MSDEIKEILEEVNKIIDNTSYNEDFTYFQTSHISKLLDYITNLQQENERLKERVAYLERSNNRREDTIIGLRFEVAEQEDYKSRCEKAIEYINKLYNLYYEQGVDFEIMYKSQVDNLLNILQKGSE